MTCVCVWFVASVLYGWCECVYGVRVKALCMCVYGLSYFAIFSVSCLYGLSKFV